MIAQGELDKDENNEKNIALLAFHYKRLPCEIRKNFKLSELAEAVAAIEFASKEMENIKVD